MICPSVKLVLAVSISVFVTPAPATEDASAKSLLVDPTYSIAGPGPKGPKGTWTGIGEGKGTFAFRKEGEDLYCVATSDGPARLQFGSAVVFSETNPAPPAGSLVRASVSVRGNISALGTGGQGPVLQVLVDGPGKSIAENVAPQRKAGTPEKPGAVIPSTGDVPWTLLESVFLLPENTRKITMLMYLMNSAGSLEWKNPDISIIPAGSAPVTLALPAKFLTGAELRAELEPKYREMMAKRLAERNARIPVPAADDLYTPNARLTGPHPRYFFAGSSVADIRSRLTDPAYASHAAKLAALVDHLIKQPVPPKPSLASEDPLRFYADQLLPVALFATLTEDSAKKADCIAWLTKWVDATLAWGLPEPDLPLSQQMLALSAVYDWLHTDLPEDSRARIRIGLIERARWMWDPSNISATQWRLGDITANHNWFNYCAMATAAVVLWGDETAPLLPGELKSWMDEAIQNFYAVEAIKPQDGAALEGYLYQDYGLRPLFDYFVMMEQVTDLKHDLINTDAFKNLSTRIFSVMPGNKGFLSYSDSKPDMFGSAPQFHFLASRFKDSRSQALAGIMLDHFVNVSPSQLEPNRGEGGARGLTSLWRSLFWFDSGIKPADITALPLFHDWTDFGLYVARSGWTDKDSLFAYRTGKFIGETGSKYLGETTMNGHGHPDQGNVTFLWGTADVLPGSDYARIKNTTMHNLVVFEGIGKESGKLIGQLGSGMPWYGMGGVGKQINRPPKLLDVRHGSDYHTYLSDLGGIYKIADDREPAGSFFPTYYRSVTYLPRGVVVIIDRVETPQPRTVHFRLLTAATDLALSGKDFTFTIKGTSGRIMDFSPDKNLLRTVTKEDVFTWGNNTKRQVATLIAKDAKSINFAVVLGMNDREKGITLETTTNGALIRGATAEPLHIVWPNPPSTP